MPSYRRLTWDSEFFGFNVARILPGSLDGPRLGEILDTLRRARVRLAYWASRIQMPPLEITTQGGKLVDLKTTFAIDLHSWRPTGRPGGKVETYIGSEMSPALEALAVRAGEMSRFSVDSEIPRKKFTSLYQTWMARSVSGELAFAVLVTRAEMSETGVITLGVKDGRGDIGLVAVDPRYRGKGLGSTLVTAALERFQTEGYASAQVVTQGMNKPACALYEKCGFAVESTAHFYHFWL